MYKGKKIIAIIPARGGSKGIPRKNIVDLGGYPLIAWTILRARKSKYIDQVILSSEDGEIIDEAKKYGCDVPFKRPDNLAKDKSSSVDVILHALKTLKIKSKNEYFILLQPTSPLRSVESIDSSIEHTIDNSFQYVMSVSNLNKSPYHIYTKKKGFLLNPLYKSETDATRRQDLPEALVSDGMIYLCESLHFTNINSFKPDLIHYYESEPGENFDIDTINDLEEVRNFVNSNDLKP